MHYYNGVAAAKRIGISYKTLLRYIEKGKIRPEEAKTPTGQLVISGDQVEAARKEVLKERSLFEEDEIAVNVGIILAVFDNYPGDGLSQNRGLFTAL